ncbi:hypothetical protein [Arcanobacterium phocae]|uniref:hypothetical protein n=1 Tax=Arcanobacterium phocae TaxID=131112 RepID=UPI001C0E955E|nr:hypothetical protein [Arcanobacterium phocae]
MIDATQRARLIEILRTPINVQSHARISAISQEKSGEILSTQRYYCGLDADMSDLAVGFYEIIYREILQGPILKGRIIANKMFAGDTMSTFNTTANRIPEAGQTTTKRTSPELWPNWLRNYWLTYGALANFWVLPSGIGRGGGEKPKGSFQFYDYMDKYLGAVQQYYEDGVAATVPEYGEYFEKFNGFVDFCKKHFLVDAYVDSDFRVKTYSDAEPEKVIATMRSGLNQRAQNIANSVFADELWEYFNEVGLC